MPMVESRARRIPAPGALIFMAWPDWPMAGIALYM